MRSRKNESITQEKVVLRDSGNKIDNDLFADAVSKQKRLSSRVEGRGLDIAKP